MDAFKEYVKLETRRQFFGKCALGLGSVALGSLLPNPVLAALEASQPQLNRIGGLPSLPHFAPKAKRVIFYMLCCPCWGHGCACRAGLQGEKAQKTTAKQLKRAPSI